jgi:hypothetical protein
MVAGPLAPPALGAQPAGVVLQLRPRTGDTLRLRLDQTVEMTGTVRAGAPNETVATESSTLVVLTRLVIESADADASTVLAITDSVRLSSSPNSSSGSLLGWAKAIEGQRFRFRVSPDGSTSLAGRESWGGPQVGAMFAQMPATLPRKAITPGSSWNSSMIVSLSGTPDTKGTATLLATFRFDSLSPSGELAFLSVRGRLTREPPETRGKADLVETSGTVTGYVLVDRRRGWITDARTTIAVRSLVIPADPGKPPMRVLMTISQWMRAM